MTCVKVSQHSPYYSPNISSSLLLPLFLYLFLSFLLSFSLLPTNPSYLNSSTVEIYCINSYLFRVNTSFTCPYSIFDYTSHREKKRFHSKFIFISSYPKGREQTCDCTKVREGSNPFEVEEAYSIKCVMDDVGSPFWSRLSCLAWSSREKYNGSCLFPNSNPWEWYSHIWLSYGPFVCSTSQEGQIQKPQNI